MNKEPDDDKLDALNTLSQRVSPSLSMEQVVEPGFEMVAGCVAPDQAVLYRYRVTGYSVGVFPGRLIQ